MLTPTLLLCGVERLLACSCVPKLMCGVRFAACKLPAGAGVQRSVVVLQNRGDFSQDGAYISYAE